MRFLVSLCVLLLCSVGVGVVKVVEGQTLNYPQMFPTGPGQVYNGATADVWQDRLIQWWSTFAVWVNTQGPTNTDANNVDPAVYLQNGTVDCAAQVIPASAFANMSLYENSSSKLSSYQQYSTWSSNQTLSSSLQQPASGVLFIFPGKGNRTVTCNTSIPVGTDIFVQGTGYLLAWASGTFNVSQYAFNCITNSTNATAVANQYMKTTLDGAQSFPPLPMNPYVPSYKASFANCNGVTCNDAGNCTTDWFGTPTKPVDGLYSYDLIGSGWASYIPSSALPAGPHVINMQKNTALDDTLCGIPTNLKAGSPTKNLTLIFTVK